MNDCDYSAAESNYIASTFEELREETRALRKIVRLLEERVARLEAIPSKSNPGRLPPQVGYEKVLEEVKKIPSTLKGLEIDVPKQKEL